MNSSQDVYDVLDEHFPEQEGILYHFVSKGKKEIIKFVLYNYVKQFNNRPLFNLGFGDFDNETGMLSDEETSGNDDHYRVFNTVLSTIPKLLAVHNDAVILVRGSDSTKHFIERCRKSCVRKCSGHTCRKSHRRINIYRNYVDKHFELLNQEFSFYGIDGLDENAPAKSYKTTEKYSGLIVEKRLN